MHHTERKKEKRCQSRLSTLIQYLGLLFKGSQYAQISNFLSSINGQKVYFAQWSLRFHKLVTFISNLSAILQFTVAMCKKEQRFKILH